MILSPCRCCRNIIITVRYLYKLAKKKYTNNPDKQNIKLPPTSDNQSDQQNSSQQISNYIKDLDQTTSTSQEKIDHKSTSDSNNYSSDSDHELTDIKLSMIKIVDDSLPEIVVQNTETTVNSDSDFEIINQDDANHSP